MNNISRLVFLCLLILSMNSCTVYTEKQSRALSRAAYATNESLEKARLDLAKTYSDQTIRIVKPPNQKIEINSIYKNTSAPIVAGNLKTKSPTLISKQRVLVIPKEYENDFVIVVNTIEYQQLLKDKQTFEQLKKDHTQLTQFKIEVDKELVRQQEYTNKMIKDLNSMQKQLVEKDLTILHRNILIVGLLGAFVGATYLRIKGVL